MKSFYYVIQTLLHSRGSNLIKIISLTLGITVSILIFARQAFEFNYDTCYKDHERLYVVKSIWDIGDRHMESHITMGPVAGAIADAFPEEVESATVTQQWWRNSGWFRDNNRFTCHAMTGDSCFFSTIGIPLVTGNPNELTNPDVLFISRSMAREAFAEQDPIGQTLTMSRQLPMTVKGVFEDFPENSSFYGVRIVMSLASSAKHGWGYWGWRGGDSYLSCIRLRHAEDFDKVTARFPELVKRFYGDDSSVKYAIELTPVKNYRMDGGVSSMRMVWILLTLAVPFFSSSL